MERKHTEIFSWEIKSNEESMKLQIEKSESGELEIMLRSKDHRDCLWIDPNMIPELIIAFNELSEKYKTI